MSRFYDPVNMGVVVLEEPEFFVAGRSRPLGGILENGLMFSCLDSLRD